MQLLNFCIAPCAIDAADYTMHCYMFLYTVECRVPCLHGDCVNNTCHCHRYWQGAACNQGTSITTNVGITYQA